MPEMVQPERIILQYQAMAAIIRAMLAAARAEDWDGLGVLEAECAAHVATLQRDEPQVLLSSPQSEQKAASIVQMLDDDRQIRQLASARMTHLSNEMHNASTERKLSRAYGS